MMETTTIHLPGYRENPLPEFTIEVGDNGFAYFKIFDRTQGLARFQFQFNLDEPDGRKALAQIAGQLTALLVLVEMDLADSAAAEDADIYDGATHEEAQEIAATREETS